MANTPAEPQNLHYRFHCLAWIDILGQSSKLRQLSPKPTNDPETRKLVGETALYILKLRQMLRDTFERTKQPTPFTDLISDEIRQQLARGRESIRYRGFSDSFLMWVSFTSEEERLASIVGVYTCMATCCLFQLSTLCYRQPIRGAIEVGLGVDLSEDEIYGPVLERAYFLEKEKADYPRILVGDALWNYLEALGNIPPATEIDQNTQHLACQAKSLVTVDTDGLRMLDFLGRRISDLSPSTERRKFFSMARDYISEQMQVGQTKGNERHRSRYERLDSYFERSSAIWNRTLILPPHWR
jgi:hypothetical protein